LSVKGLQRKRKKPKPNVTNLLKRKPRQRSMRLHQVTAKNLHLPQMTRRRRQLLKEKEKSKKDKPKRKKRD
jgi:hypothetical protein